MKVRSFFVLVFLLSLPLSGHSKTNKNKSLRFLSEEVSKSSQKFRYNKYESIISGGAAFLIGNIGYFSTESVTLKLAYSGIQTIGILNIGDGIYDNYSPTFDRELYKVARGTKSPDSTAYGVINILAKEEKAKRISLLWKSSLLATQYFSNAYLKNDEESLKDIYKFLGGVNLIVAGYSYFYQNKYESYIFGENSSFSPTVFREATDRIYAGMLFTSSF